MTFVAVFFSVKLRILYRLHIEQVENSVRRYVKPPRSLRRDSYRNTPLHFQTSSGFIEQVDKLSAF